MTRALQAIESAQAALEDAARFGSPETIASIAMPAPVVTAAGLARALEGELRFLWRDRHGALHGGVGVAATVGGSGRGRFDQARDGARALYRRVVGTKRPLYGGFAFEPGSAAGEVWKGFGDARFDLPAVSYIATANGAELRLNVCDPLNPTLRRAALAELERRTQRLRRVALDETVPDELATTDGVPLAKDPSGRDHYLALVSRARELVRSGSYEKLVVARSRLVELERQPELARLLGRIDSAYQDCTVFCVQGDNGHLVAASPERLATVRGDRVETVALAGTVPIARATDLHSDAKLQLEHQLTVDAIAEALQRLPGAGDIEVQAAPRLYRLRKLVHLETPITARLTGDVHIFDVASALHPTPAVAGIPTSDACAFLREHEGMERGWYAGLVGWCDESGDGELAVALRAGLLSGNSMQLFAGAGIVGDSDPVTEWDETSLKLSALGAQLVGKRE